MAQPDGQTSHTNTVSGAKSKRKTEEKKHTGNLKTILEWNLKDIGFPSNRGIHAKAIIGE